MKLDFLLKLIHMQWIDKHYEVPKHSITPYIFQHGNSYYGWDAKHQAWEEYRNVNGEAEAFDTLHRFLPPEACPILPEPPAERPFILSNGFSDHIIFFVTEADIEVMRGIMHNSKLMPYTDKGQLRVPHTRPMHPSQVWGVWRELTDLIRHNHNGTPEQKRVQQWLQRELLKLGQIKEKRPGEFR